MEGCQERLETKFESVINRLKKATELNLKSSSSIRDEVSKIYDFRSGKDGGNPVEVIKSETIISMLDSIASEIELSNKTLSETINGLEQILP